MRATLLLIPLLCLSTLPGCDRCATGLTPAGDAAPGTGLLLHLPLDAGSFRDVSGHDRPTSLSGAVPGAGGFADCFLFDGVDDHIAVADFAYGPEFTVAFWFNSPDNAGRSYQYMFSHGPIHEPNSGNYYFVEDGNRNFGGEIKTNLLDADDADRAEIFNTRKGLSDGAWHLYTVSVAAGGASVYIDGELVKSADQGGGPIDPPGMIHIGTRADREPDRAYAGYLDDVRLYGRALSAGEVKALHSAGR